MFKKPIKPKELKKYRVITIATISSIAVGIVIILIGMIYYKYRISQLGISDTTNYKEYDYHLAIISEEAIISDEVDASFWDAIYKGALEKGKEQNAYVEEIGSNLSIEYSLQDLMRIAIASKVDGIILEPNGDEDISDLIEEADAAGIPVVTVLRDLTKSKRISYVGINSYTQGKVYANEVMKVIKEGKKNITVLLNEDETDKIQMSIYSSILGAVGGHDVTVNYAIVKSQTTFGAEEDIRKIIMDTANSPDLLVCLTEVDTRGAYQAVVDYNKVGDTDIIGYYDSDIILRAIEKNIVHSTMTIDANQMGASCVQALTEYLKTNNVSDFFPVGISAINKDNVKDYIKDETNDENE